MGTTLHGSSTPSSAAAATAAITSHAKPGISRAATTQGFSSSYPAVWWAATADDLTINAHRATQFSARRWILPNVSSNTVPSKYRKPRQTASHVSPAEAEYGRDAHPAGTARSSCGPAITWTARPPTIANAVRAAAGATVLPVDLLPPLAAADLPSRYEQCKQPTVDTLRQALMVSFRFPSRAGLIVSSFLRSHLVAEETQSYRPPASRSPTDLAAAVHLAALLPDRILGVQHPVEPAPRPLEAAQRPLGALPAHEPAPPHRERVQHARHGGIAAARTRTQTRVRRAATTLRRLAPRLLAPGAERAAPAITASGSFSFSISVSAAADAIADADAVLGRTGDEARRTTPLAERGGGPLRSERGDSWLLATGYQAR